MHTALSNMTNKEILQRIWANGEYVDWSDEQKEVFRRLCEKESMWFVRFDVDVKPELKSEIRYYLIRDSKKRRIIG